MTNEEQIEMARSAWREVFPYSHIAAVTVLRSVTIAAHLGNGRGEWSNGIALNDPLNYSGAFEDDTFREYSAGINVRPPEGSPLYCESERMRRVTIHGVTHEKLVARFKKLREFLIKHREQIMPGPFNLAEKLGAQS